MKKLSRDERIGAAVLAAVVFLVVGSAFVMRQCAAKREVPPPQVTILYSAADSTANKDTDSGRKEKKKGNQKKAKPRKGKEGKRDTGKGEAGKGEAGRDFLSDPVPTKRDPERE